MLMADEGLGTLGHYLECLLVDR